MPGADKSFEQIKKGQMGRESELLSQLLSKSEFGDLETFEAGSAIRRNELLFKIQNDMEDTKNALKQAEQLTDRLRRRLSELEGMYRILTKK
ncbi:MAG: hypothetical protein H8E40_12365 [Chloroflexi bacterium]|nr:hypothetical protein [Chloroflexota bacterium]MBL7062115.1 hypothetical protein [Dehalococcoidia bacterium]